MASVPRGKSLSGGPSIIMPPGPMLGPPRKPFACRAIKKQTLELEMKIMKFRQLSGRNADQEFQARAKQKIEELEQKLREIDE